MGTKLRRDSIIHGDLSVSGWPTLEHVLNGFKLRSTGQLSIGFSRVVDESEARAIVLRALPWVPSVQP